MAGTQVANRLVVTGIIGALVAFLCLAGLSALATQPFRSADESAHTAYAIEVGQGHLPTRQTVISPDIPGQHAGEIYVASHPPLYYLLIAPALTWGLERGTPLTGFYLARLETILMSLVTIALTAYLAVVLFRKRRPDLAVASAGLLATTGVFAFTSSFIYNDALSTLLSTALITGGVLVMQRGLRPGPGILVLLSGAAAVATRTSNAPLVVVAGGAFVLSGAVHACRHGDRRDAIRGAIRGGIWAVALAAASCASAGWFVLRNQDLYGRMSGRSAEASNPTGTWKAHGQTYPGSAWNYLTDTHNYWAVVQSLYGDLINTATVIPWSQELFDTTLAVIWTAGTLGFVAWILRERGRLVPDLWVGLVVIAFAATTFGAMVWFIGVGSYPHPRYLFPMLPIGAVLLARSISALPFGRFLIPLAVAAQAVLAAVYLAILPAQRTGSSFLHAFPDAMRAAGFAQPNALAIGLLCAAAVGVLVCCGCALRLAFPLRTDRPRATVLPPTARWVTVYAPEEPVARGGPPVPDDDPPRTTYFSSSSTTSASTTSSPAAEEAASS